jgi:coproporphyrinogen III oxidase-like Fe-S oxidoreductase
MFFARVRVPGSTGPAPVASSEQLAKDLKEAAGLGVDEVSLYNYALLPEREVHEFVTAVRRAGHDQHHALGN